MRGRLARLGSWSRSQRAARAAVLTAPAVALAAAWPAGSPPPVWLLVVTLLLGAVAASAPDSAALTVVLLVVVAWWALVEDPLDPAVLVAAALLATAHVAALLAALGPPQTPLDGALVRLWVRRGAALLATAPLLWAAARQLDGRSAPTALWPAALGAVVVAVVVAALAFPPPAEPA